MHHRAIVDTLMVVRLLGRGRRWGWTSICSSSSCVSLDCNDSMRSRLGLHNRLLMMDWPELDSMVAANMTSKSRFRMCSLHSSSVVRECKEFTCAAWHPARMAYCYTEFAAGSLFLIRCWSLRRVDQLFRCWACCSKLENKIARASTGQSECMMIGHAGGDMAVNNIPGIVDLWPDGSSSSG